MHKAHIWNFGHKISKFPQLPRAAASPPPDTGDGLRPSAILGYALLCLTRVFDLRASGKPATTSSYSSASLAFVH